MFPNLIAMDRRAIRMGHSRLSAVSRNRPEVARSSKLVLGFRAGLNQPRKKPAGHAADRNKCTLQDE
jgi:hypothetical protein